MKKFLLFSGLLALLFTQLYPQTAGNRDSLEALLGRTEEKGKFDVYMKLQNNYTLVYYQYNAALAYRAMGKTDSFLYYLKAATITGEPGHYRSILKDIYKAYSEYYDSTGDHKNVFLYLKKYSIMADSLYPENLKEKIVQYEGEKAMAENELLSQDTMVRADVDSVLNIMRNLVGNAIKFSPKGSVFSFTLPKP